MKAKRFLSVILSLVMAVSVMSVFAVSASADSVKKLTSGTQNTISLSKEGKNNGETYKITLNKSGQLTIAVTSNLYICGFHLTDMSDKGIMPDKVKDTSGSSKRYPHQTELKWNSTEKKYKGTLTYQLEEGSYYLTVFNYIRDKKQSSDKVTFKATFPSADAASDVKITSFTLEMKKGDTIQLGTLLSADTDDNVTWKSSKTAVAKVSATGKITAQSKGSATITASIGDSSVKIQVNVS